MQLHVLRLRHDQQIFGHVVLFVSVNVMNDFATHQGSPNLYFGYRSVFLTAHALAVADAVPAVSLFVRTNASS